MAAPRKILICEDEDAIREFEVINLQRSGYEVVDVCCGEDAIRVFDEQGDSFSVAILDIMMPGIDGFAVCKHIREKNNTLGIIMLSAKSQEMDKVNGLMLGADDYITKPFSPSELMEHFMRNPNVALDRSALLTTVWGDSYFGDDKIVDVNVRRLRMKIEPEPSNPKYLTTVWGFGYKWVE